MTMQNASPKKQNPKPESKRARTQRLLREFALHLAGSPSVSNAATLTGISRSQATRWIRSEAFLQAFRDINKPDFLGIESLAKSLIGPALRAAGKVINDEAASSTAKINALAIVARLTLEFNDRNELERELAELREYVEAHKKEQREQER